MAEKLVFLHLSDIHFAKPKLGHAYDLDADLRSRLEADAERISKQIGSPHGILISGDIAFSGIKSQYEQAKRWLDDNLCGVIGGDPASIRTVSGNHDINQSIFELKPLYLDVRRILRECDIQEIEKKLMYYLTDPEAFYSPLKAYNEFAFELGGCDVSVAKPVWDTKDDYRLNDNSVLRIHGLNSSLISDTSDDIDTGKMILGKYQTQIPILDGVENLVMCHHPPDWLRDGDLVEETLNPRCSIQLFGHKHKHRLRVLDQRLLQISAGAVHPSRSESDWEPRYNWFTVSVRSEEGKRYMDVEVYPRIWSNTNQAFEADYNRCDGNQFKLCSLQLRPFSAPTPLHSTSTMGDEVISISSTEEGDTPGESFNAKDSRGNPILNPHRTLAQRYFQLGYVNKMQIASQMQLLSDEDAQSPDHTRQRNYLKRARDRGILAELWDRVEEAHGDGRYPTNPFKKD